VDKIKALSSQQSWEGLQVVDDLAGSGRGVVATRQFAPGEVVCDYHGSLLSHKDGKSKYNSSPENAMGYMFAFSFRGVKMWIDATDETRGPGRLINHSKCHGNVSIRHLYLRIRHYEHTAL